MEVEYRGVPGFPGYRVGSDGTVWSRFGKGRRASLENLNNSWTRLSPFRHPGGYGRVAMTRNGRRHFEYVHRLVLIAFVGGAPPGNLCCHENGDPSDNRLENLRWDTQKSNCGDTIRHGRTTAGERQHNAKLRDANVTEIRTLYRQGKLQREIAEMFDVNPALISMIVNRKIWRHIP